MKSIFAALILLCIICSNANAGCEYQYKRSQDAYQTGNGSVGLVYKCTVDSENTISALYDAGVTGQFQVIDTELSSGATAPDSVTPTVSSYGVASRDTGVTVFTPSVATTDAATGRQKPDAPELITGGIKISFSVVADEGDIFYIVVGML